jgi:hypothetical protein
MKEVEKSDGVERSTMPEVFLKARERLCLDGWRL